MPVMSIREVTVAMAERDVFMDVVVWLLSVPRVGMFVLMVRIMGVRVSMPHGIMPVQVRMSFCQV